MFDGPLIALDIRKGGVHEVKSEDGYSLAAGAPMIHTKHFNATVAECCGIGAPDAGRGYIDLFNAPWQAYIRALDSTIGNKVREDNPVRSNHYGAGLLDCRGDRFSHSSSSARSWYLQRQSSAILSDHANVFAFGLQEVNP
jgi:hypothetical protein